MSIIMLDTFNYAMDTITGQFAEVRGHALNRLGDKAGAAAAGSSDSFALTWGGAAPMPEVDDTRFMPAPMAFLNGLPPDVRKTIGLLKSDGGEADHTKACPLYWTAAAKRVTDRLDKLLTFVGGNAKTHFGAMFSKCSFEMEYGERITVRKGSQFSVGARGHLTVHTDGNEFVNIGEVYDENANTTKPANAKKKKKTTTDGQEQEPPQAATKKQKVDAAKPGGAVPGSVLAAAPAPAGGGAKAGGVTFGKTSIAPGKVVKFGVRPNTPLARPVGPTYEEYVGLEKVIYDFGLCTGTTQGKVKIANEAERKEEDGTRYRYVRYDSSGGHSSDLWAPPNGWADSLQKNTMVCRKDLFSQLARFDTKFPEGLIGECQGQKGVLVTEPLTCKAATFDPESVKCGSGAHAFDNTFWQGRKVEHGYSALVLAGSAPTTVPDKLEPWCKGDKKLTAEQWAAMAAAVPEFIKHYKGEAPGSAADFKDMAAK